MGPAAPDERADGVYLQLFRGFRTSFPPVFHRVFKKVWEFRGDVRAESLDIAVCACWTIDVITVESTLDPLQWRRVFHRYAPVDVSTVSTAAVRGAELYQQRSAHCNRKISTFVHRARARVEIST